MGLLEFEPGTNGDVSHNSSFLIERKGSKDVRYGFSLNLARV